MFEPAIPFPHCCSEPSLSATKATLQKESELAIAHRTSTRLKKRKHKPWPSKILELTISEPQTNQNENMGKLQRLIFNT